MANIATVFLALGERAAKNPYVFKTTGQSVFSFEEAQFYCFGHWKETSDDFASPEFINWIQTELNLAYIASCLSALSETAKFSDKLLRFLRLSDFFSENELTEISQKAAAWEATLEWERLKERADGLFAGGVAQKAYALYKRALLFGDNAELLNNIGLCALKLQRFDEAYEFLERAFEKAPDNFDILLNFIETAIACHSFNKALYLLRKAEQTSKNEKTDFLFGKLCVEMGDVAKAASYFEKAVKKSDEPPYLFALSDVYCNLRRYDDALSLLEGHAQNGGCADFYLKQSEVYMRASHIPAAIKCVEKALLVHRSNAELWLALAVYHRKNYDLAKAAAAVQTALNIEPRNDLALMESARIKKASGSTKAYQEILKDILNNLKNKYRESEGA